MSIKKKLPLTLAGLVLASLLAFPVAAQATLTYVRNPFHPTVFVANDDGSGAKKLASGETPHVSPDGNSVAYLHVGAKNAQELKVANLLLGTTTTLMSGWREPFYLEWSPDSNLIAALRGPELGKRKLVLIDVASGAQRVIAQGFFSGFSFSPSGSELVYAKAGSERFPPRSDIFSVQYLPPGVVSVAAEKTVRLTKDHNSSYPLWGPQKIVFVKTLGAKKRKYGPKNELYLMNPNGKGVKRLTHTKVPPLLQGLFPTAWSASGNELLAEFEGQDTSYAVKVNPETGKEQRVGFFALECPRPTACRTAKRRFEAIVGTAISNDGRSALGYTGGFEPGPNHDVISVPFSGGKPNFLAKNAFEPDWSL